MLQMKIISKVEIEAITEEYLAQLIKDDITRQNPQVVVTNVVFEQKRNPTRIEATVEAHLNTGEQPAVVMPSTPVKAAPEPVAEPKLPEPEVEDFEEEETPVFPNTSTILDELESSVKDVVDTVSDLTDDAAQSVANIFAGLKGK